MTQHDHLVGICLSHRLCPVCRRGYLSRKKAIAGHCPNPECRPGGRFIEYAVAVPPERRWMGGDAIRRPLFVERVRCERLAFRMGGVILSPMPADGTLWTWLSERDASRVRPR